MKHFIDVKYKIHFRYYWIIDLGPNGGEDGGLVMFSGTPQNMIKLPKSHTGQELKKQFILK